MLIFQNGSAKGRDGQMHDNICMWTYWCLQEGTLGVNPDLGKLNNGGMPPVIHMDTDAPLYSDVDGSLMTDKLWGLYYKPDFSFNGIQGGAMPYKIETDPDEVRVDPYGPDSPDFVVGEDFAHMWCSALAFCQKRFEGKHGLYRKEPSGGIGAFSPDSFPVFDIFVRTATSLRLEPRLQNDWYGKLVAGEILGESSRILEPFRFSRYAEGRLHPCRIVHFRGADEHGLCGSHGKALRG
jgi:hypothetical protein